jgi:TRAP-type C4-dicarboxylate transport system substrate-binding protein
MNRLLAALLPLLALTALCSCERPLPAGVAELTYATPYPPSHPFSRADQRWIDHVESASGGTLRIRPLWSGSVLSADMSMEELRHGVADIGLITPIYVRGGTHLIRMQSGFYSGADSIASQVALFRCLQAEQPQVARELAGLRVLAVQGGPLPGIVTRDSPIRTLADLKGLRIRAPTELLRVLDALGADPVNMPMGDVYSAMAKGVIDGVIAPPDTFRSLHFTDVAKYYSTLRVPRGAYPARAIGVAAWNRLTPQQRLILDRSVPVWEAALSDELGKSVQVGLEAARSHGIVFSNMLPAEQERFDALYLRDARDNAEALGRFGIDGLGPFRTARSSVIKRDTIACGGKA